jgi:large subunit ribosomal protein L3
MAGQMGNAQHTVRCGLVKIDAEKNLLLLRGPVPGANNGLLFIRRSRREYGPIQKPEAAQS